MQQFLNGEYANAKSYPISPGTQIEKEVIFVLEYNKKYCGRFSWNYIYLS